MERRRLSIGLFALASFAFAALWAYAHFTSADAYTIFSWDKPPDPPVLWALGEHEMNASNPQHAIEGYYMGNLTVQGPASGFDSFYGEFRTEANEPLSILRKTWVGIMNPPNGEYVGTAASAISADGAHAADANTSTTTWP
jgi:hypothetical protein